MGYTFATGPCVNCATVFAFDPELVPAYRGQPICLRCIERVNVERRELGMEPVDIYPGTYDTGHSEDRAAAEDPHADDPDTTAAEDARIEGQGWGQP